MDTTLAQRSLADLAMRYPAATAVFHKYNLDYCDAGHQSLHEAAQSRQLDIEKLINALTRFDIDPADAKNWTQAETAELIDYILNRFHTRHRQQFPELIRLAEHVELEYADHPDCPNSLALLLMDMQFALETHMQKEEQVLFPMLLSGVTRMAAVPVSVMRREHEAHEQTLQQLQQLTRQFTPPDAVNNRWRALYSNLQILYQDLTRHIHLENDILFQRIHHTVHGS